MSRIGSTSNAPSVDTDFFAVAGRQRACRAFLPDPIADEDLRRILTAATMAPSSENKQPWVFVAVKRQRSRERLVQIMHEVWEAGNDSSYRAAMDPKMRDEVASGFDGALAVAPVIVVVGADTRLVPQQWMLSSMFPAVQNLLLATYAAGAASTLTTIANMRSDEIREAVGFPAEINPTAIIPIGYPARTMSKPRRNPVEDCSHAETYGTPLFEPPAAGR